MEHMERSLAGHVPSDGAQVQRVPFQVVGEGEQHEGYNKEEKEEQRLVSMARKDRTAFSPLYGKYVMPVYRYFYGQTSNIQDAEDLTSITFSKALASLDGYRKEGSFASWLFGIARHALRDYQRAQLQRPQVDAKDAESVISALEDRAPQPETRLLHAEQLATLDRLIQQLPDDQREVLTLRIFGEFSTRDVATMLGRSEAAAKMLLYRAVTTLRTRYTQEG